MDLLRFLLRLPIYLLRGLRWLLTLVLGDISWRAPGWMRASGRVGQRGISAVRARPGRFTAIAATLIVLAIAGGLGYRWYRNQPRPIEEVPATFQVAAPQLTDYSISPITVSPARITFTRSVAPLALVGKVATAGIELSPELAGQWTWVSDRELDFQPKEDWPVGQDFDLRFDRKLAFAEHIKVDKDRAQFKSAEFTDTVAQGEFYQDPQDATAKKAVIHIAFSHPVDTASFEKRIALRFEGIKSETGPKKFAVNYDERKLNGYIHSEPLSIPLNPATLAYTIDKGVHAARGGEPAAKAIDGAIGVPGLYSLGIDSIAATLVDNAKFEPEQVLVLEASQAISERDTTKAISAWVLPQFNPKTPEDQRTTPYSWSTSEVGEDILRQSQKLNLEAVPTEREFAELHSFKFRADPGRNIFVKVDKGIKSFGGYVLGKPIVKIAEVPEYPKMLRFMADGALLSLSGDKRVSVVARNVPAMQMEIARVLPDQLQHLVTFNRGTYAKPEMYSFSADNITERFVQKLDFPGTDPGKAQFQGVDLGQYLGAGSSSKRGVFLLKLSQAKPEPIAKEDDNADASENDDAENMNQDAEEGEGEGENDTADQTPTDSRLVVVTDLGLIAKKSLDGSQDVYVQSIHTGAPVTEATVDLIGRNGQTLFTRVTDHDGQVHFDSLEGLTREKTPAMYVVHKADDESFLPIGERDRMLDYSRFDIGGEHNAKDAGKLSAYLFSDRGIYRPGDTFHVGLIVRAADWARPLAGVPLEAEIVDARGAILERRKLRLNDSGFDEISFTTQESAPTGGWNVNLYIVKDGKFDVQIGSVALQIKEFQPDRMKAEARLSHNVPEGWVKPDNLKALFVLQNLFGTPAQNRRVEATLSLTPTFPVFHNYTEYRFFDPQRAKEGYSEPLGEHQTDEHGEAEFPLDLTKYGTSSYQLRFFAKGYEAEGGRNVAAEAHVLVSSLDYLIGAKAVDNLDFVTRGAKRSVNLIALDPNAKTTAVDGLKAAIIERRFVSILTKQDSGVYKYESKSKEIPVTEKPLTIAATGTDFDLPTETPGTFALVVRNAHGEELNRVEYTVAGEANVSRSLERNAELQLALSKHDFAPSEDIEIAIRAPYAGSGLITLERDKVYAHAWFHSATTGSVQKIKVPADFEGNGYVNVQFVRDPASDEIFMSPLSYGVVPFSVNRDARKESISVTAPALVKPGDTLKMKVTAAQPSRVVVFAVDEGILQVARYKLGDPLDFFFRKRMLEVRTSQILDLILPEFSKLAAMAAPGGDADDLLSRHLNPFKKKHQEPVAYWSGIVDVKGELELSYVVPDDFNGKLRIMAVAVRADKVGIFQNSTTVRGDFVLSPNVPSMVAPGDEFEVSVGVANNLTGLGGKEIPVKLTLSAAQGLEVVGAGEQELTLGEMREGALIFKLRAKPVLGPAKLEFKATYADKSAKIGSELSVRPAVAYRNDLRVGELDHGQVDIAPLRDLYDEFAKREVAASYTPLVLAQGLSTYLADFPHRCTEQLVSQAIPALVFGAHPEYGRVITDEKAKPTIDALQSLYSVLHTRQNSEGGFGLWTSTPQPVRYVSVHAMQFLVEAKERGQKLPGDMLESGNRYLQQLAADESDASLDGLRERAYAIYLLTRQGNVTTNAIASVQKRLEEHYPKQWQDDLVAAYLAASFKLLKQDKDADRLMAGPQQVLVRSSIENAYRFQRYYDPLVRDATTLYLIAKHFPERSRALPTIALQNILRPLQKGLYNTLSSGLTILALDAYGAQAVGEGKLALFELHKDGNPTSLGTLVGSLMRGTFTHDATGLRVENSADLRSWYAVTQSGFDRAPPTQELKQGLEILREFTTTDGHVVTSAKLGEELDVHLKIRATEADSVGNIAIIDLLPGGFEPVLQPPTLPDESANTNTDAAPAIPTWHSPIGTSGSTWVPEYADVRDDRVVIYGTANRGVQEFIYRIRATNAGNFIVPPAYGESMYDRTVQARSLGTKIEVTRK